MKIRLRKYREARGLSVRQLATLAGVGFATVHRIEVGRISPTVAMLERLATALDIPVRDFFPKSESKPTRKRKPRSKRRRA
jgi:transcriptional regulator with XRE-family HTH domain